MTEQLKDSWDSIEKSAAQHELLAFLYVQTESKSQQEPINLMGGIGISFPGKEKPAACKRKLDERPEFFSYVNYCRVEYIFLKLGSHEHL